MDLHPSWVRLTSNAPAGADRRGPPARRAKSRATLVTIRFARRTAVGIVSAPGTIEGERREESRGNAAVRTTVPGTVSFRRLGFRNSSRHAVGDRTASRQVLRDAPSSAANVGPGGLRTPPTSPRPRPVTSMRAARYRRSERQRGSYAVHDAPFLHARDTHGRRALARSSHWSSHARTAVWTRRSQDCSADHAARVTAVAAAATHGAAATRDPGAYRMVVSASRNNQNGCLLSTKALSIPILGQLRGDQADDVAAKEQPGPRQELTAIPRGLRERGRRRFAFACRRLDVTGADVHARHDRTSSQRSHASCARLRSLRSPRGP